MIDFLEFLLHLLHLKRNSPISCTLVLLEMHLKYHLGERLTEILSSKYHLGKISLITHAHKIKWRNKLKLFYNRLEGDCC